ncbi:MAG: hypothetical protein V4463_04495 [Pseudomonadota bacterium]
MTQLVIRRAVEWLGKAGSYRVLVDDTEIGTITQGEEVTFVVEPGRRKVHFAVGKCSSQPVELSVVDGKKELIECGPNYRPTFEIVYRTLLRDKYIWARRIVTGSMHN